MIETLPTAYFKKNLRIISNTDISKEQINLICEQDPGFNRLFLE
jgi:hypothetical protein